MTTILKNTNIVRAKEEVIGVDVQNNADEDLGEICELVLDKLNGKVLYAVLESGTFLGMGGKLFAIPWQSFHFDPNKDCFILNMTKDRLKMAPGFDKDNWPDMADSAWADSTRKYYSRDFIE